jgi:hypothetical protein
LESNSLRAAEAFSASRPAKPILAAGFELAHLIHRSQDRAQRVVETAASHLDRACDAQLKRVYYHVRGQPSSQKSDQFRSKVILDEPQLFQLLIYKSSEPLEKSDEVCARASIDRELLVVRFVKQLVQLTMSRNAFYVLVGIGRILFDYSTSELTAIEDYLYFNRPRIRDECYYRSRKALLMRELHHRFGNFLRIGRGLRGECRFLATQSSVDLRATVFHALRHFTPWNSRCLSGSNDVWNGGSNERPIAGLDHSGELSRMHALLHPQCLEKICQDVGLDLPDRRLRIPRLGV